MKFGKISEILESLENIKKGEFEKK